MDDKNIIKRAFKVWDVDSRAIKDLEKNIDKKSFLKCIKKIAECTGRIVTSGCGTSAAAAKKISHSFSCIERPSFFLSPADAVHGALGSVQEEDIVFTRAYGAWYRKKRK
jgi:D-arabinose 5-phosphate isomerase GutQ